MWNDPAALNRLTGLILLATIIFVLIMLVRAALANVLPIQSVEVHGAAHAETVQGVPPVLARLRGGLFSVNLETARQGFEAMPWVRSASLRRMWPGHLHVQLEEHVPAAAWNDLAVLNVHGEVFPVRPWPGLPRFQAPEGMEKEVAIRYGEFARMLSPGGWRIAAMKVDARHAWRLTLFDGVVVELGRERLGERLNRFVVFYPRAQERVAAIRRVDMRYPNGFAVQGVAKT